MFLSQYTSVCKENEAKKGIRKCTRNGGNLNANENARIFLKRENIEADRIF